jgi:hypothetical protein
MAIYKLLNNQAAFDDAAVKSMTTAYEDVLRALALADRSDPLTQTIAEKILHRARSGERDVSSLRDSVAGTALVGVSLAVAATLPLAKCHGLKAALSQ